MLKNNLHRTYGWDVELTCSQCKFTGQPRYEGWSSSLDSDLGPSVNIRAKLACPRCGTRLTREAGRKLVALFGDMDIPEENKKILSRFIRRLFLVPASLAFVIFLGMKMDWWDWGLGTLWILLVSAVAVPVFVHKKNKQIAGLPTRCDCGKPYYIFMGSIDNNQCYRCFSCGSLLIIRE